MEGERWKPLVGTPSKPPISPDILVPDPSPARSTISDEDSLTLLPPSPEGSFIHRRRQGQYVPRPPVWKIDDFSSQEFKDFDTSYDNYPATTELGNGSHSNIRLPGISIDDQIRQMANVFYEQPLVVNMMTGHDTEDTAKTKDAQHTKFEADLTAALGSGSKLAAGEPSHTDSSNPSGGTTALGSNCSSNLMEKNMHTTESLEMSSPTPPNPTTKAPVLNDPITAGDDFPEAHLAPQEVRMSQKGKQREEVPTSAAGAPSHNTATGILPELKEGQQEAAITQEEASSPLPRPNHAENDLTYPTTYDASHIAKASRLPNALKNSSATEEAGIVNVPEGSKSDQATTVPQRPAAKRRSLKDLIHGSMRRSTGHHAEPSGAHDLPPLSPKTAPGKAVEEAKGKQNPVQKLKTWGRKLTSGIRGNIKGNWSGGPFRSKKLRTGYMRLGDQEGSSEASGVSEPSLQTHTSDNPHPVRVSSETHNTATSSNDHSQSATSQQPFDSTHLDRKGDAHPGKRTMREDPRDIHTNVEAGSSFLEEFPAYVDIFDNEKEENRRSWGSGHESQASRFGSKAKRDQRTIPEDPQSVGGQGLVTHPGQNDTPTTASPAPVQAPLGDITNSSRPRRRQSRIAANQPEASGPSRSHEGSPTAQELYAAQMAEVQEELVQAPPPASRPMTPGRPNALRPEIRRLNPNSSLSDQSSG